MLNTLITSSQTEMDTIPTEEGGQINAQPPRSNKGGKRRVGEIFPHVFVFAAPFYLVKVGGRKGVAQPFLSEMDSSRLQRLGEISPTLHFPTVFGLPLQLEESISVWLGVIGVLSILNKKELLKTKT